MKQDTFANRLKKAMDMNGFKQIDLVNKTKLDKSLINKYLNGISEAGNDKLTLLSDVLNVSEPWLMGYDVPIDDRSMANLLKEKIDLVESCKNNQEFDELELLFSKNKDILTEDDKEYIKFIIEKRKKEIDKQLKEE